MKEIKMGKTQELTVLRETEHGVYLGKAVTARNPKANAAGQKASAGDVEEVLLPKGQTPAGLKTGALLTVFVYRDSEDRPVATVRRPAAEVGEFAYLTVKSVTKVGAFLDWGLEKDLFLPYKETESPVKAGDAVMVYLYLDKSGRIASTTRIYEHLSPAPKGEYRKEDAFRGAVYRVSPEVGALVAVSPKNAEFAAGKAFSALYYGLIPTSQVFVRFRLGETVSGRIVRVRADGKLDLALRARAFEQLSADGETILKKMREYGGTLPFSENASPEIVKRELGMSKNAFKKALGHLYRERKVRIGEKEVSPY